MIEKNLGAGNEDRLMTGEEIEMGMSRSKKYGYDGGKNCAEESSLKRSKEKTEEEEGILLEKEWVTHQILDDESCES